MVSTNLSPGPGSLQVYPTPRILRTPDLSQPQTAFPTYAPTPLEQVGLTVLQGVLQGLWHRSIAIMRHRALLPWVAQLQQGRTGDLGPHISSSLRHCNTGTLSRFKGA